MNFMKAMKNKLLRPWGYYGYSGYQFYSVDYQKFVKEAYNNPIIYSCIKEIINDFNAAEICVYRQVGDETEKQQQHDVQKLLDNPNPELTKSDFQEYYLSWLMLGGGLLMEKTGAVMKTNKNLNLYPADSFEIKRDSRFNIDGIKVGDSTITGNNLKRYRVAKTVNVEDEIAGYGDSFRTPLKSAAVPSDLSNFSFKHNISLLANMGKRIGIMEYKKIPNRDKLEEAQRRFDSQGSGVEGAGRVAWVNGENFKFTPIDSNPSDLDWINGMTLARELICATLGVPVSLISSQNSSYNNITEFKKKIYQDTVIPLLKNYCENMTKFLQDELGEQHYIWYDISDIKALEEDNTDSMVKVVNALSGIATVNEIRKIVSDKFGYSLDEQKGKQGYDEIFIQQSMIPLSDASEPPEEVVEGEEDE